MNPFAKVVLVVDDSSTVRRLVEWALKPAGVRLLQATDGVHALEILQVERVDLAFVDLNMPRMDGLELTRTIRADQRLRSIPIVLLTTETREQDRRMADEAGVTQYLTKPHTPELLRATAEKLLGADGAAGDSRRASS